MNLLPLGAAFLGGLVSFFSPCVLPLIPGFLAYLAGTSLADAKANRREVFLNTLFFVLGFSVVFSLLGVLLNSFLSSMAFDTLSWLSRVGGFLIIAFGVYLTGLVRIPFLENERKLTVKIKFSSRYLTSFVLGAAFSVGWTPCVGPILGSVIALAATQPGSAFVLLLAYSLGLGIPFLIVGLFVEPVANLIRRYAALVKYLNIAFGLVLIGLGWQIVIK